LKPLLVATLHDADRRLFAQSQRVLPQLLRHYSGAAVLATAPSHPDTLELLENHGLRLRVQPADAPIGLPTIGRARREALALGVETGRACLHFCDWDRILHWAEFYAGELAAVLEGAERHDCTVHGRTKRAFQSHPRAQRDTEAIGNQAFALASGQPWDITAVSRALSLRAAQAIVEKSRDDSVGSDASWILLLLRDGSFSLGYAETEGLEFETADRYADEVAAAGGLAAWIGQLDSDVRQWALRTEIALCEVQSAAEFARHA
jgi:hypothetical protein